MYIAMHDLELPQLYHMSWKCISQHENTVQLDLNFTDARVFNSMRTSRASSYSLRALRVHVLLITYQLPV